MIVFLRASLFNFIFYGATALACVLCLPGLFLPREKAMLIVRAFVWSVYMMEKYIIGLDYEVRGAEHLPKDGAYIVAAKHQSPYETMKLHRLFHDPAIVLKRELLRIPLWGKFLGKIDPIAIDRKSGKEAIGQVIEGARRVQSQGRPIIIFPQGTRVFTWQTPKDKPYKVGAARMQHETGMTIVPLALNTGMFWPRNGWIKQPGKVIFQFLPPLPYESARTPADINKEIEALIESATKVLETEALAAYPYLSEDKRV